MIVDLKMHFRPITGIGILLALLSIAVCFGDDGVIRPGFGDDDDLWSDGLIRPGTILLTV